MLPSLTTDELLIRLSVVGLALSSERDLDKLLNLIVSSARHFTNAEAATLYLREGELLRFIVAQNSRIDAPSGAAELRNLTLPLNSRSLAGHVGVTGQILCLDDAYAIPPDRPYQFNRDFDIKHNYRTRSLLLVPMKAPDGETVGVVQLINSLDDQGQPRPFEPGIEPLVLSLASQAAVCIRNVRLAHELKDAYHDTILRLSMAAEHRDAETGYHIQRMSRYSAVLARGCGLSADESEMILHASRMHDIGKLGIPDAILLKPGKLTPEEFTEMQKHTLIGARILANASSSILRLSEQIALTHHEKWDGSGYPNGRAGEDIPLPGRIAAVADVFDALTSRRCYKPPFSVPEALGILRQGAGKHFDPRLVQVFEGLLAEILEIKQNYADPEPQPASGSA